MARGHFMFRGLIIQSMPRVGRYVFPSDHADELSRSCRMR
jgi:hypothetical protein